MASILSLEFFYALVLSLITTCFLIAKYYYYSSKSRLPPGPRGWPLLGALPLLGKLPHAKLADLSMKYGPVMYLKMGTLGMVVASTPSAAHAFLKTLDSNFCDRPLIASATYLDLISHSMVFAPYGPCWKLLRKLCNLNMFGGKAIEDWAQVRHVEVGHMLQDMYQRSRGEEDVPVMVSEMVRNAMTNMIGKVIMSRPVFTANASEASRDFKDMVVELMIKAGMFNIGDFIPSIAWMDLQGTQRGMTHLLKKFDSLLTEMIHQHVETKQQRSEKPDFLDHLLMEEDNGNISRITIKSLLIDLFTAGTDTSSSIIEWAMAELMINPAILRRAQEEMDNVIGRTRRLEESDIPSLPYLQAICKETLRKHPSTPLNLPRISTQACQVDGYYIPKGTRLSVNIWAIGRDPNVWENPLEFNPERFLSGKTCKIEPNGNDFELIPFGGGRRICPGTRMGIVLVEYILGTFLHSFDWEMPEGAPKEMNMEETFGLTLQKSVPLSTLITSRLPPALYTGK